MILRLKEMRVETKKNSRFVKILRSQSVEKPKLCKAATTLCDCKKDCLSKIQTLDCKFVVYKAAQVINWAWSDFCDVSAVYQDIGGRKPLQSTSATVGEKACMRMRRQGPSSAFFSASVPTDNPFGTRDTFATSCPQSGKKMCLSIFQMISFII